MGVTLDTFLRLDVRKLARDRYVEPGGRRSLGWMMQGELAATALICAATDAIDIIGGEGEMAGVSASVPLEETVGGTFGGTRKWFLCPRCRQRCAIVYCDGTDFTCRTCIGVPYLSASLGKSAKRQHRLHEARAGLNLNDAGEATRPKGMSIDRWIRRWDRYWAAVEDVHREVMQRPLGP
jgi:hypothetical protein